MEQKILSHVSQAYPWRERLQYFPTIDSTNDRLREMAKSGAPQGTVLVAGQQTGGHGRRGRSFHSPADVGVYLSILLRPGCRPEELMHLTCAAAEAMCDAVAQSAGFRPGIKWTNDLVAGRRKLGGILTELGFAADGSVDWAIIGIGINCCQTAGDFPADIRDMAASLSMAANAPIDRAKVAAAMMDALWKMSQKLLTGKADILSAYCRDCVTLGQQVALVRGDECRHGLALDIDENGALMVEFAPGHIEAVNSGEVSVRGMYGYL